MTPTQRAAMQAALDALMKATPVNAKDPQMQADAIVALRAALAEPAVEPVDIEDLAHSALQEALSYGLGLDLFVRYFKVVQKASPPPAEVPLLTDGELHNLDPDPHVMFDRQRIDFARAIEKAVRQKAGLK